MPTTIDPSHPEQSADERPQSPREYSQLTNAKPRERLTWLGHGMARSYISFLLLGAAGAKFVAIVNPALQPAGLFGSRSANLLLIEFEFALGALILFGIAKKYIFPITLATFIIFSGYTIHRIILGDADCGCFGRINVKPQITVFLDIGAILLLALCWRSRRTLTPHYSGKFIIAFIGSAVLCAGTIGGYAILIEQSTITSKGITSSGNVTVLDPTQWVGAPCPILDDIDVGTKIKSGSWRMILFSSDCDHCISETPRYLQEAKLLDQQQSGIRMVIIELAPAIAVSHLPVNPPTYFLIGKMKGTREWFAETPVLVELHDGIVKKVEKSPR